MKYIVRLGAFAAMTCVVLASAARLAPLHMKHLEWRCFDHIAWWILDTPLERSELVRGVMSDYLGLNMYQKANAALPQVDQHRVVFYGDSITFFWSTRYPQDFFPGRGYIDRSCAGQTTASLRWRYPLDVAALHPKTVVLLAGVNDLFKDPIDTGQTEDNIRFMVEEGRRHNIRTILCSLLPVTRTPAGNTTDFATPVRALNTWLRQYAQEQHLTYIDYYDTLAAPDGKYLAGYSDDGLHPNGAGYTVMENMAMKTLDAVRP